MNEKQELINNIKENLDKIGVNIDCSRFEDYYGGYCDSRDWFMKFDNGQISIDVYLGGLSEDKLKKMIKFIS